LRVHLFVCGLCLCVLSGCGGSSGTGNLRFVQASPDAPESNLYIDGKLVSANLGYGNASGYISLDVGTRHVQVVPGSGASPILDLKVSVVSSGYETLIETGKVANKQSLLLTDTSTITTTTTATITEGGVRVVNAALNMGTADVYVVAAGSSIAAVSPVATVVGVNSYTGYELVPVGAYEVFMTAPGTKNVFLNTGSINMTSDVNQTVVALDGISGGFTFIALTDQ
jgi:Domain of unknown function (DUF4397)